ncbi:DUF2293 domain-containing protein [Actinoplanes sp. HUAS TT8]|uniref:DUF2293 domain-containing protein n=1 Tax=Actinoplanes sp. HUAS TT8 TaxID=3447453 RepID=UPI003F526D1B
MRRPAPAVANATGNGARPGTRRSRDALDPEAVTRAVVASIRHVDTPYDEMVMNGVERDEARERIRAEIDRVLDRRRRSP